MDFYEELYRVMAYDPGGRGFSGPMPELEALGRLLAAADRVLLLTGFPVAVKGGTGAVGETDGPVGTAELAAALSALGCRTTVATDAAAFLQTAAALRTAAPETRLVLVPEGDVPSFAAALLDDLRPDAVISLERPGKGIDGHFHSMRGRIIDRDVADTDCFLALARDRGIPTVGIGDGGNELGMGALRRLTAGSVPHGEEIAAVQPADYTLTAGVSNWWGNGLAALLSYETGRDLLTDRETELEILRAVVDAGGVDGCTGLPTLTVDGLPLEVHLDRLAALERLQRDFRGTSAVAAEAAVGT